MCSSSMDALLDVLGKHRSKFTNATTLLYDSLEQDLRDRCRHEQSILEEAVKKRDDIICRSKEDCGMLKIENERLRNGRRENLLQSVETGNKENIQDTSIALDKHKSRYALKATSQSTKEGVGSQSPARDLHLDPASETAVRKDLGTQTEDSFPRYNLPENPAEACMVYAELRNEFCRLQRAHRTLGEAFGTLKAKHLANKTKYTQWIAKQDRQQKRHKQRLRTISNAGRSVDTVPGYLAPSVNGRSLFSIATQNPILIREDSSLDSNAPFVRPPGLNQDENHERESVVRRGEERQFFDPKDYSPESDPVLSSIPETQFAKSAPDGEISHSKALPEGSAYQIKRPSEATVSSNAIPLPSQYHLTREGGSNSHPVLIKSESSSGSNEGPGYHQLSLSEDESLDLDDLGLRPKRIRQSLAKAIRKGSFEAPGKPKSATQGNESEHILVGPTTLEPLVLSRKQITEKSQPRQENLHLQPQQPSFPAPAAVLQGRGPAGVVCSSVSETSARNLPQSRSHRGAVIAALEDGTDGESAMYSESQVANPEADAALSALLHTPATRAPQLRRVLSSQRPTSAPPNGRRGGIAKSSTPSDQPTKRKAETDPPQSKRLQQSKRLRNPRKFVTSASRTSIHTPNEERDHDHIGNLRHREARKDVSFTKDCCKGISKFIEKAGVPAPAVMGPRWASSIPQSPEDNEEVGNTDDSHGEIGNEQGTKAFVKQYGRHNAKDRHRTPPDYWKRDLP